VSALILLHGPALLQKLLIVFKIFVFHKADAENSDLGGIMLSNRAIDSLLL
jgi:hypothetical protein